ncbi:ABC1 kinase family protein [Aeoliella sp. SH292]|uniref:ABC1 kinase family protein n=1 Tax=Aeoliella sp. SH292 TaxID=3454464 RepID=UPI003F976F83
MKISTIPQIYRNLRRWREILAVLSKYGLAGWANRLGLTFGSSMLRNRQGQTLVDAGHEERIRLAIEELGPTFIKLGQVLSTRPDQVGFALADELTKLQQHTPADGPDAVVALVEEELERPLAECFATFNHVPVASASIGQVHRATLHDGTPVAVKVQHAGIDRQVRVDLEILSGLAQLADSVPELQPYRLGATMNELQRMMRQELDFCREARNQDQFARQFEKDKLVRVPGVYCELSTKRVLTMEWLAGSKLSDLVDDPDAQDRLPEYARRGAEMYLKMIFEHGFYHADPHPGNLVLMSDGAIGLLDFGMVARLSDPLREQVEDLLVAIACHDSSRLTNVVMRIGSTPPGLDDVALATDLTAFVDQYAYQSLDQFDLSGAFTEFVEIVRRYEIVLPSAVAMLIKTLLMLEGMARMMQPSFSLMEVIEPYRGQIFRRRMSPKRHARKIRNMLAELEQLAEVAPRRVREILEQVQRGSFDVHLDHRGLEPSVNRLVLGLLTSALFLGSSVLLSQQVWAIREVSVPGTLGMLLSGLLGLRLLRAINKSGHLDRKR